MTGLGEHYNIDLYIARTQKISRVSYKFTYIIFKWKEIECICFIYYRAIRNLSNFNPIKQKLEKLTKIKFVLLDSLFFLNIYILCQIKKKKKHFINYSLYPNLSCTSCFEFIYYIILTTHRIYLPRTKANGSK